MSSKLFARFTFSHSTTIMLDTQWQNARMILRMHMLRDSALQQINQIVRTTVQRGHHSRQWSIDLSMICWSRLSKQVHVHTVFEMSRLEIGVRYMLAGQPPFSIVNWVQVRTVGDHTHGSMNFNRTFFFLYERHSMCKQFVSL